MYLIDSIARSEKVRLFYTSGNLQELQQMDTPAQARLMV